MMDVVNLFHTGEYLQFLVDLALKGAVIMVVTAALSVLLRRASAATRHLVWTLGLSSLLALPILTLTLPTWRASLLPSLPSPFHSPKKSMAEVGVNAPGANDASREGVITAIARASDQATQPALPGPLADSKPPTMTGASTAHLTGPVLLLWVAGVLLVLARLTRGMIRVRGIVRDAEYVIDYLWGTMVRRLAGQLELPEHVALMRSPYVAMPVTWGVLMPVVLLPEDADEWSEEWRRIVLLHELAHIKRRDCLTQLLAQVACAIYWFNPLVWFAARRLRVEREMACDDYVLGIGTRASDYAKYLIEIARATGMVGWNSPVAAGIACSQLESRVSSILDPTIRRNRLTQRLAIFIFISAVCLIIPLAALQPWGAAASEKSASRSTELRSETVAPIQQDVTRTEHRMLHQQLQRDSVKDKRKSVISEKQAQESLESDINDSQEEEEDAQNDQDSDQSSGQGSGTSNGAGSALTVQNIIDMKKNGVTPEFVESMRRLGYNDLSVKELVRLRVHDINEEFIKETKNWSNEKLTVKVLVNLKVSGVNPEYFREMKKAGYDLPLKSLARMRMFGVTPEFIETMRKAGYPTPTAEQLTALKIHGVSEHYLKELRDAGFDNLTIDQLTRLRMLVVTPDYIKEMRDAGFDKLTPEELVKMRMHGVTVEYVKKVRAAGLKNTSANQLLQMKIRGIEEILIKK